MRSLNARWIFIAVALLAVGCANQKEPAEKALAQIDSSVAAVRDDAARYAADELQSVEASLSNLKEKLGKGEYKAVLAEAPNVDAAVNSLKETVATRKAEAEAALAAATTEWNALSADVPKMVDAIQSRVDILSKSSKLPKNVSQDAFNAAKSGLESMKAAWGEASAAFAAGDATTAVAKASSVKQQGNEVLQQLGMKSG